MIKTNAIFFILYCFFYSLQAWSQDSLKVIVKDYNITGIICDDTNTPIEGVNVCIYTFKENKIAGTSHTSPKGIFIIKDIEAGKYKLKCSHIGYSDFTAELIINKGQNLSLGTLIMYTENIKLNEVTLAANRNIFTTEKQSIYPSQQQIETSGGGMDLLQKLPIPLLDVNPINRTVSSLDTFGGVALLINDIPADANDIAIIDPKHIKRVDVIRKPGMEYGSNLAIAINIVLKEVVDGIILGVNGTNSMKLTNGNNNLFAKYNHRNSQLTINQSENYQNYFHQSSDDLRQYLMPNGDWHSVHIKSLSERTLSATHGTTIKYNLTVPDKYVFQSQGYLNLNRNPKLDYSSLVSETGKTDFINQTHIQDHYQSPALNLYYKKYLPKYQNLIFNVVGTYINSGYNYLCEQEDGSFLTEYGIKGHKYSVIGEMKYNKGFQWGNITSGFRSFYYNTRNHYTGSTNSMAEMENLNTNIYAQINGRWKQISGSATLSLEEQYYSQQKDKYNKLTFNPRVNLNYTFSPNFRLGYGYSQVSRLPALASLNNITIQMDQWERRVGNPFLKPFNHIENSLSATYNKSNIYAMLSTVYASNKKAIMPSIIRTENDGQVYFDYIVQNQRNMNQFVFTSYLRYAAFKNKLIISGMGIYDYFHADSYLYSNKKSFFYANLKLESYLDKFYLSASVQSRYNSLFAETIWYNEYSSSLNATYNWKNLQLGITWQQPLQRGGTNNRVETINNVVNKVVRHNNPEAGNNVLLTLSWSWSHGFKSKVQETDLNNKDSETGILK